MTEQIQYASFGDRLGAYIIDALVIVIPTFGLNYLKFYHHKKFLYLFAYCFGVTPL